MRSENIIKEISQLLIELRLQQNNDDKNIIMDQIDSYFKDLYDKLNTSQEIDEINKIKECIAVIVENYAPIFNDLELIAINKLKSPRKLISFNRSYSEKNLLVQVRQDFESLEKYGVDLAKARTGYATIAEELPDATKLGNVYSETGITYGQTEAEAEQFKDSAEAKRKKQKLIETEKASFRGSAGVGDAGLSTQYLRRGSSAGQY
jgi:hypothetical protein